jgi:hypothetical protein
MDLISFLHSFNDLFFFGGYIITLNYFFLFYVEILFGDRIYWKLYPEFKPRMRWMNLELGYKKLIMNLEEN